MNIPNWKDIGLSLLCFSVLLYLFFMFINYIKTSNEELLRPIHEARQKAIEYEARNGVRQMKLGDVNGCVVVRFDPVDYPSRTVVVCPNGAASIK